MVWEVLVINISCVAAWEDVIKKEYERDTHPSSYEYEKYFKRSKCLIALTQIAIDLSDNDDKEGFIGRLLCGNCGIWFV